MSATALDTKRIISTPLGELVIHHLGTLTALGVGAQKVTKSVSEIKRKGCHSAAIKKNNMTGKNRDKDRWLSQRRAPYERVFSKRPNSAVKVTARPQGSCPPPLNTWLTTCHALRAPH